MHIPDNYISPETCAVMTAVMIPVWIISARKVSKELTKEKVPMIGVGAAFSFVGMMFNVPMPGGTTGHAVGGTLIAGLLGPYASCIAISVALLLQALIFGDGGILAFGANCFNMAFILPFVGYGVMKLISRDPGKDLKRDLIAAGVGSYAGINAAAFCAAIEFGIQPLLFTDAAGNALYCPYGLNISVPAMMIGHLTIFGIVEVIFTVAILAFIRKTSPGMIAVRKDKTGSKAANILLVILAIATPLGLLAEGTAWGEWGVDEIASTGIGYTPKGMLEGFEWNSIIPDYSFGTIPEWMSAILSAVIGIALLVIIFKLIGSFMKPKEQA